MQHIISISCFVPGSWASCRSTFNIHRSKKIVLPEDFWDLVQARNETLLSWFVRVLREILLNKTWPLVPTISSMYRIAALANQTKKNRKVGCEKMWTCTALRQNVLIYLGIPLLLGIAMWAVGRNYPSYRTCFLPRFAPSGLIALLWTVVMMFAEMSKPLLGGQAGNDKKSRFFQSMSWFERESQQISNFESL